MEVEAHFKVAHDNTKDLLCPFCLKVLRSGPAYMQHYMKHQVRGGNERPLLNVVFDLHNQCHLLMGSASLQTAALIFILFGEQLLQFCFRVAVPRSRLLFRVKTCFFVFCLFHKREKPYIAVENAG